MMRDPRLWLQFMAVNVLIWGVVIGLLWKY